MFKCHVTKKVSKPGEPAHKLVLETRKVEYVNSEGKTIAEGWEIVKEVLVSEEGLKLYEGKV